MLYVVYGHVDSGKTTFARHLASKKEGKALLILNEGQVTAKPNEQVVQAPRTGDVGAWFKEKWNAIPAESQAKVSTIVIDSITGINDAYAPVAIERCLRDEKLKNKSAKEKAEMTLTSIPFGMGESTRAELVKEFILFLVDLAKTKDVIVIAHTQMLSVIGSDQVQQDIVSLNLGGKAEKSAASRNALLQHADVVAYCDATPERSGAINKPARKLVVGAHGVLATKYKAQLFGKDEFFQPEESYDILGKDALLKTINDLF